MNLFGNFIGKKAEDATVAATRVLASLDPATMGEAGIRTIGDALREANRNLAETQASVEEARKKVDADGREIKQRMGAAEILLGKGQEEKAGRLLAEVEDWNGRLDGDKQRLAGLESSLKAIGDRVAELEDKLRTARRISDQAQRDLQDAKLDKQRAQEMEQQARKDAGLTRSVNDLDAAMSALGDAAKKNRLDAEAARRNAASLSAVSGNGPEDADVKAAMAEAAGTAKPQQSVAERLAAMKERMGQAA